jgi:DNA-directed RNA polymerase subunit M/transcription elongation factor TFIIS
MADLPKELFNIGHPDIKREYHFININGEEEDVELNFGDSLSFVICPLDGAHIVHYSGDPHTVDECPACKRHFEGNEESVVKYVDNYFIPTLKENIKNIKKGLNYLEKILELAENPNNEIKKANKNNEAYNEDSNKVNLSAKEEKASRINYFENFP